MYPKKPGWERPGSAHQMSRFVHQSFVGDFLGPFACHAQAYYKHVEGYRSKPTVALSLGTAYDRTKYGIAGEVPAHRAEKEPRDGYFKQQLDTGEMPSLKDTRDLFAAAWDEEAEEVEDLTPDDKGDMHNRMDKAIGKWRKDIAPTLEPDKLHMDYAVAITGEDWFLRGSLDMTAYRINPNNRERTSPKAHLRDTKTSKSSWAIGKANNLIQGPHYSILVANKPGLEHIDKDLFVYDVAVKNKAKANVSEHEQVITDDMRMTHLRRCSLVRDMVSAMWKSGNWLPNREALTCSRENCGFWEQCEKDYGGTVRGCATPGTKTQHATTTKKKEAYPV